MACASIPGEWPQENRDSHHCPPDCTGWLASSCPVEDRGVALVRGTLSNEPHNDRHYNLYPYPSKILWEMMMEMRIEWARGKAKQGNGIREGNELVSGWPFACEMTWKARSWEWRVRRQWNYDEENHWWESMRIGRWYDTPRNACHHHVNKWFEWIEWSV